MGGWRGGHAGVTCVFVCVVHVRWPSVSYQSWMTMGPRILRLGCGCGGARIGPCGGIWETLRRVICSHGCRHACLSWERDSSRRALLEGAEETTRDISAEEDTLMPS